MGLMTAWKTNATSGEYFYASKRKEMTNRTSDLRPVFAIPLDLSEFTPRESEFLIDNLTFREEEPEDAALVASGILPELLTEALNVPPSNDWERVLDEL